MMNYWDNGSFRKVRWFISVQPSGIKRRLIVSRHRGMWSWYDCRELGSLHLPSSKLQFVPLARFIGVQMFYIKLRNYCHCLLSKSLLWTNSKMNELQIIFLKLLSKYSKMDCVKCAATINVWSAWFSLVVEGHLALRELPLLLDHEYLVM